MIFRFNLIQKYFFIILIILNCTINSLCKQMYCCTAANDAYFKCVLNLIGSLHKHNFDDIAKIAVFNIGLSEDQINHLNSIENVQVFELELVHPDLLKEFDTRAKSIHSGKPVPGWYAWKAVAIKQALDIYPAVLWIDAGTTILRPINTLFEYIGEQGYFLHNSVDLLIKTHVCAYPRKTFDLDNQKNLWILNSHGVEAGLMGFTKKMYSTVVYPAYQLAHDLRNFEDDGTSEGGFGWGRHDTTVFSIIARINNLKIYHHPHNRVIFLKVNNQDIPFHITGGPIPQKTHIYISRKSLRHFNHYASFIKYKK